MSGPGPSGTGNDGVRSDRPLRTRDRLEVPFDVVLATWAWLGPADVTPIPRLDRRSAALVGAAIALVSVMVFGQQLFGWGGLLDAHEPDLQASVDLDCGPPEAGPPPNITVGFDWSGDRRARSRVAPTSSSSAGQVPTPKGGRYT